MNRPACGTARAGHNAEITGWLASPVDGRVRLTKSAESLGVQAEVKSAKRAAFPELASASIYQLRL